MPNVQTKATIGYRARHFSINDLIDSVHSHLKEIL